MKPAVVYPVVGPAVCVVPDGTGNTAWNDATRRAVTVLNEELGKHIDAVTFP